MFNDWFSKEDFQDCQTYMKGGQQFFCGFEPLLNSKLSPTCLIQLFNSQVKSL